jgi:hypothetical protein
MRYFTVFDDVRIRGRWHIGDVFLSSGEEVPFVDFMTGALLW